MKRLWRRVLMLTALAVMMMAVYASAAPVQYIAKNGVSFTKWKTESSNQFTVGSRTAFTVHVKLYNNYTPNFASYAYTINNGIDLMLQNVASGQIYYLTDKDYYSREYDVHITVDAGTYRFSIKNHQNYWFNVNYRVTGNSSGIDVDDTLDLALGDSYAMPIYFNVQSTTVSEYSPQPNAAIVNNINNTAWPNTVTFYGNMTGTTYINVHGKDGSFDQIKVTVYSKQSAPKLLYDKLTLSEGESIFNDVLNTTSDITWTSSKPSVVKVSGAGKISAVKSGSATITATIVDTGKKLTCKVTVPSEDISFIAQIITYKPSSRLIKVRITNYCEDSMKIFSSGAQLLKIPDSGGASATFPKLRTLKLKSGSSYTVRRGKKKTLSFSIRGSKVKNLKKSDLAVRLKFSVDGTTYYLRCVQGKYYAQYELKGSNNWMYSYLRTD